MKSIILVYLVLVYLVAAVAVAEEFVTGQAARIVLGQRTFTEQEEGARQDLLGGVSGLAYAADTLFVVDSNRVGAGPQNERVLIYKNLSANIPKPGDELPFDRICPACRGAADVVLGQVDFSKNDIALTRSGLRTPTSVASDGNRIVVADTDNNRVLIWNSIPSSNGAQADVVVGQPDFTHNSIPPGNVPNSKSMRGPQGVWLQNGKLFVADTQNHRVLIYNSVPTSNGAPADIVVGQPDFGAFVEPDLTRVTGDTNASNLINPVSVTSDGIRLYVSDLGHNRVLIWNSIPTRNQTPADVVVGQPDMTSAAFNNSPALCPSNGTDTAGAVTYPPSCEKTLNFPRYALSDGQRLFIADGGNDRVLIYNRVPTSNGAAADAIVGQLGGGINQASDATDSMRTPMSLAWDGVNLYVSDSFNRRVMVYSIAPRNVPYTGVRNAASLDVFAVGGVKFTGTIAEKDVVTVSIDPKADDEAIAPVDYKYTAVKDDTFDTIINGLVTAINGSNGGKGDPSVFALANLTTGDMILTAKAGGADGNNVGIAATVSTNSLLNAAASGATLSGGQDAAKIAPGTIVTVLGDNLSDDTASAPAGAQTLPQTLANTQVYFDGIRAPLFFVSPTGITAQVPFEVVDRTSINAYVRTVRRDGSITVTSPVAVTIVQQNPGIFAEPGNDPRRAIVMHGSASATGTISVDGTAHAGDVATVKIEDRAYVYTVVADDTLATIRDRLIELINQDPKVQAFAAGSFTRIRLRAKIPGPEGNGITFSANVNDTAQVILSPLNVALCCANAGPVTDDNPAIPGETITVYATGIGISSPRYIEHTGVAYDGPNTDPVSFVSSLAGGKTANVLLASLKTGEVGKYQVDLELNSDLPTNPLTQLTIAQDVFVSNIVTFPVLNPGASSAATSGSSSAPVPLPSGSTAQAAPLPAMIDAVRNAASGAIGVAPSSWISIYGSNLATATRGMESSDIVDNALPTTLAGVSVKINGKSAFVHYVSPTQINVLSPSDSSLGSASVTVTNSAGTSTVAVTTLQSLSPALFVLFDYLRAVRPSDSVIINGTGAPEGSYRSAAAAKPGDVLELFGTGFGPVENQPVTGAIFTGAFPTLGNVTVTIGGVSAPVSFAGLVGAGLYQVNVTVPEGLSAGDHVVVASIAGIRTQSTALLKIE